MRENDRKNTEKDLNSANERFVDIMDNREWKKSQIVEFTVKFNGYAVKSHEMDADELATSLLGISKALEEANSILNGPYSKMFVKVRSSFQSNSFIVDIATFFTSTAIDTVANITTIVGFIGGTVKNTLIKLFKQTKGNPIITKKQIQGDNYEITVKDSESPIIVNGDIINLYESAIVRKALVDMVYPLKNEGISDITFLQHEKECEKISRDEREYFTLPDTEQIDKKEDIDYFLITQSNFEGKQTGWRLSFGDSSDFPVKILDDDFLQKVSRGTIIISNEGTIIKARYRKETQRIERLHVNWVILEVLNVERRSDNKILSIF